MAFAFTKDDKCAGKALRRIARERLGASVALMSAPCDLPGGPVHDLRKNIKKTRALLRLVRPHFDDFAAENAALREAARILGPLREQAVQIATLERITAGAGIDPDQFAGLAAALRHDQGPPPDVARLLRDHRRQIGSICARARKWRLDARGFDAVQPGLGRTWEAARKAMRRTLINPDATAIHLWRKRVKDHWYHARLLAPIWPEMMAPHIAAANDLGEMLGDSRDSAILADMLGKAADDGTGIAAHVRSLAKTDAAVRLARARTESARLFSEPAECLVRRWQGWWQVWRA